MQQNSLLAVWTPTFLAIARKLRPGRRAFRRTGLFLAVLTATVVTVHAVENFRGRRAWATCRAQAEARGVQFSLEKLIPSSDVPDAQNFACLPIIDAAVKARRGDGPQPAAFDFPGNALAALVGNNQACDFAILRKALTAAQLIAPDDASSDAAACALGLRHFDAPLAELREGVQRPYARYQRDLVQVENNGVPPFLLLRKVAQVLLLRFHAHAASGQLDAACEDFELALKIARTLDQSSSLVGAMVQVAAANLALDGLQVWSHSAPWTDSHLARFDTALIDLDLLQKLAQGLAVERATYVHFGTRLALGQQEQSAMLQFKSSDSSPSADLADRARHLAWKLYPRGWHYQSLVWASPYHDASSAHLDLPQHHWLPGTENPDDLFPIGTLARVRLSYAMIALPNFQRAELRTVAVQAQLDMARVAIALERHRLAHGSYPQRLTELAANLPHDLTDTQPLRYRPTVDGHFQLYSLSFNRTDDGGSSATDPKAPGIGTNFDRLDWVWRQPQDPARTARRRAQSQGRNFSSFNCAASCFASAARGPGTLAIFS